MSLTDFLIRLARKVLENVLSQMLQQLNVVQEQALNPIRSMVSEITGGIWRGKGADAFVDEVMGLVVPGVGRVGDQITTMSNNIVFARDTIDQADEEIERVVRSQLFDAFDFYR